MSCCLLKLIDLNEQTYAHWIDTKTDSTHFNLAEDVDANGGFDKALSVLSITNNACVFAGQKYIGRFRTMSNDCWKFIPEDPTLGEIECSHKELPKCEREFFFEQYTNF